MYFTLFYCIHSCTGIEEDSDGEFAVDYEENTVQGEADERDDDGDQYNNDDNDDDQKNEDAMATNFALSSNNLGMKYS